MANVIWKDDEIIGNPDEIILAIKEEISNCIDNRDPEYAIDLIELAEILSSDDYDKDDCLVRCSFEPNIACLWIVKELKEVD